MNDLHRRGCIDDLTHVADAIALLLELDEFFGWNDRHDGTSMSTSSALVAKKERNVKYQYDLR